MRKSQWGLAPLLQGNLASIVPVAREIISGAVALLAICGAVGAGMVSGVLAGAIIAELAALGIATTSVGFMTAGTIRTGIACAAGGAFGGGVVQVATSRRVMRAGISLGNSAGAGGAT